MLTFSVLLCQFNNVEKATHFDWPLSFSYFMGVGFHINNPVPKDLIKECAKCTRVMEKFTKNEQEQIKYIIPPNILAKARGIAIVTIVKAGFLWSGRFGSGLVFAKVGENEWSAPSAISIGGMGVGGQIGAEITDFVFVLNTADAVAAFTLKGNVTIGGNLTITLGPVGRSAEAAGAIGKLAPIYAYSKSKGLFLGISLEGSVIIQRKGANKKFYGKKISAAEILAGGKIH